MEIPIIDTNIKIRTLDVPDISDRLVNEPHVFVQTPPVTVNIGAPIVDIPGCVEAHETNNPKNTQIVKDDSKGVRTYCDAGVPSYDPIQYEPEQLVFSDPPQIPVYKEPEADVPEPKIEDIPTPPPEKPATVELIPEVPAPEPEIPWVEKYLPAPEAATTTAAIAVVATTSALMAKPLADILLRVIKPTVKKVIKKIAAIRGKEIPQLSVSERRIEQRDRNHAIMELRRTLKSKS